MANHKSAVKRARQSVKRNLRNRAQSSAARGTVKKAESALAAKDAAAALPSLKMAESALARLAQKGVIKKKTASRKISRLTKRLKALKK
ncbi:MAG: 30S ribosomal protein S20 [Alphaproteobacteria bacterium]